MKNSKNINIVFSVDWEGRELDLKNLNAMKAFREDYPHIPILQFLNAAYFTKPKADIDQTKKLIESVLLPIDEIGLHIHGWKSQFETCGVPFRNSPSFNTGGEIFAGEFDLDIGHDIPISEYTTDELVKVIKHSKDLFNKIGWGIPKNFRCGGWISKPHVLKALELEGVIGDYSAVPCKFLDGKRKSNFLHDWLFPLWSDITPLTQPYKIGNIIEWPNNGCLADYVSGEEMLNTFKQNWEEFQKSDAQEWYVSFGFHQETANKFLINIREAIKFIESYCQMEKIPHSYPQLPLKPLKIG
jgi:hypothetical protein